MEKGLVRPLPPQNDYYNLTNEYARSSLAKPIEHDRKQKKTEKQNKQMKNVRKQTKKQKTTKNTKTKKLWIRCTAFCSCLQETLAEKHHDSCHCSWVTVGRQSQGGAGVFGQRNMVDPTALRREGKGGPLLLVVSSRHDLPCLYGSTADQGLRNVIQM